MLRCDNPYDQYVMVKKVTFVEYGVNYDTINATVYVGDFRDGDSLTFDSAAMRDPSSKARFWEAYFVGETWGKSFDGDSYNIILM